MPISFLNFEVHGSPRLVQPTGQRPGCTPHLWGLRITLVEEELMTCRVRPRQNYQPMKRRAKCRCTCDFHWKFIATAKLRTLVHWLRRDSNGIYNHGFLRCFRDPNRVPRYVNRVPRIKENYHRVPRIRENRVPTSPYRLPMPVTRRAQGGQSPP